MKTNVEIDDALVTDALKATGLKTQQEVVEFALKTLIQMRQQEDIRSFRGQFPWDSDLESMRANKPKVEAQLISQATQKGVSIEQLLETLIGMLVDSNRSEQSIAPQEKAARFSQWARNHAVTSPLSDAAVSRESIYTREDEIL